MCQRSIFSRSCSRIAEEVQLQAEEEFILETLKKIKQQRNCLQIERLHLESLKLQLEKPLMDTDDKEKSVQQDHNKKNADSIESKHAELKSAVDMMTLRSMQHKDNFANIDEDIQCNNQELNLNLNATSSGSGIYKPMYGQYDYHSDEGSSSDVSDGDNVMIDINMLMNANSGRN